jgi:Anti-sigma-K factor rskA
MQETSNNGAGEWSGLRPHEVFFEMCAIATTGELCAQEEGQLREHLAECAECRQTLSEFETVSDLGAPLLSSKLGAFSCSEGCDERPILAPAASEQEMGGKPSLPIAPSWNHVWISFAAAILLTAALGVYSYEVGRSRAQIGIRHPNNSTETRVDGLEKQINDASHEDKVLKAQLAERDRTIADLRHQMGNQLAALNELKSTEANVSKSLQTEEADKQQLIHDRSSLTEKLESATVSVQSTQAQLDSLTQKRSEDEGRAESLGAQIRTLNAQLREREETIGKQEDLLAHDRDIRDLMGARDLYIAEVYDVARDGATQKPYGRVFYTRGKSLVFYAYDLDQQTNVKNASTFQVWGRRGPDKQQALNLGIFFEDSVAKKRWVLKVDDSKTLEQIDAVFVTLEPNGGSHKPSGKPLLFASLRIEPNHP